MEQENTNLDSRALRRGQRKRRAKLLEAKAAQKRAGKSQPPEQVMIAETTAESTAETTAQPGTSPNKKKIREQDITGLKYFDQLAPLLKRLYDDACQRDTAGNRQLHYDQYCMPILLFMFNPVVSSLASGVPFRGFHFRLPVAP